MSIKLGSLEILRDASIKGDTIYFPHDGPKEAAATLRERAAWLRGADYRVLFVGADDKHDKLAQWLLKRNDIQVCPHRCHNYLALYAAIDRAMGNCVDGIPKVTDAPSFDAVRSELGDVGAGLVADARHTTTGLAQAVEATAQASADDVAQVANPEEADAFSRVVLLSSSDTLPDSALSRLNAFTAGLTSRGGSDHLDPSADAAEGAADAAADGAADADAADAASAASQADAAASNESAGDVHVRRAARSDEPLSEFNGNGLNLMRIFRAICPLLRYQESTRDDGTRHIRSWPLQANGTLSAADTRHWLLQFTAAAACTPACIAVLAKQHQRHAVLRAVSRRVPHAKFAEYTQLLQSPGFWERVQKAKDTLAKADAGNADNADAKALLDKLSSILLLVGKEKPFSSLARKALKPKMMAIVNRHSDPSIFWSLSPDSVHNELTLRLSFKSDSNSRFPAFASGIAQLDEGACQLDVKLTEAWMEALRSQGEYDEAAAAADPHLNLAFKFKCGEASLQRQIANNPVAVALTFQRIINAMLEVLVGLPNENRNKKTEALLDCLDTSRQRKPTERRPGIYGVCAAGTHVFEVSGKRVQHGHGMLWSCASPKLLARIAHDDALVQKFAAAIATQLSAQVGWEVHVLHRARRLLKVPAPRGAFATVATKPTPQSAASASVAFQAVTLGDHEHTFTCHKGAGTCGCRACFERGHGEREDKVPICELVHEDALPAEARTEHAARAELDAESRAAEPAEHLRGDEGRPHTCKRGCKLHWWGEEGKEDLLPLWLLKPRPPATVCEPCGDTEMPDADANTPPPALPLTAEREQAAPSASSSNDAVYTSAAIPASAAHTPLLARDDRALVFELPRPKVVCPIAELDKELQSCDTSDGEACLELAKKVQKSEPVEKLLGSERLAQTAARLKRMSPVEAAQLIEMCKALGCANANLVEWSDVLTACTGSNAAPYFLGAGHGAAGALFYLIKCIAPQPATLAYLR